MSTSGISAQLSELLTGLGALIPGVGASPADLAGDGGGDLATATVPLKVLQTFFTSLARQVGVGISAADAIASLAENHANPTLARILARIARRLEGGASLADALAEYPRLFDDVTIATMRVGAGASKLADACNAVALTYKKQVRDARALKKAAAYPISALVLTHAVVAFNLLVLTPKLAPMYEKIPAEDLPGATKVLMQLSAVYVEHPLPYSAAYVGAWVGLVHYLRSYAGRMAVQGVLLRIPALRRYTERTQAARFLSHVAQLLRTGKQAADAVDFASETVTIPALQPTYAQLSVRLRGGVALSEAMHDSGLFTGETLSYIRAGEKAGDLAPMVAAAAQEEDEELDAARSSLIEQAPTYLIVLVSFIIGGLLMAQYGGLFKLTKAIR